MYGCFLRELGSELRCPTICNAIFSVNLKGRQGAGLTDLSLVLTYADFVYLIMARPFADIHEAIYLSRLDSRMPIDKFSFL